MSRAGTDGEEEEEQEQDCFHDSLDRILSCSNSSTSASEDDDVAFSSPARQRRSAAAKRSCPKFPVSLPNYDAWISDAAFSSSSLQHRRDRLLRALGLSSDPTLSRRQPSLPDYNAFNFSRSVSSDHFAAAADTRASRIHPDSPISPITRSKSEGECQASSNVAPLDQENLSNSPISASTSSAALLPAPYASGNSVNTFDTVDGKNSSVHFQDVVVGGDNISRDESSDKHFSGCSNQVNDEIRCSLDGLKGGCRSSGEGADCNGLEDASAQMFTIRNLDTGKEFVVNEVREDGICKKLREVGSGKQLTMEEFEICVGHSPIVQELMRRQNVEEKANDKSDANAKGEIGTRPKKKVSWLKSIKNVAGSVTGHKERRSSDERDTSSEKGGRRSSSATDDSQDVSFNGPERVRVRQYGKSVKELTAVYKSQEIQAHSGSIWSIKFSLDGRYLASAGEDCVIHVWQVMESERKGELLMDRQDDVNLSLLLLTNGSPEPSSFSPSLGSPLERKRRGRTSVSRKSMSLDHILIPEIVFGLSDKPFCSFQGHLDDVLDLSWSKSQLLLSSSMDKTVRLWELSSKSCLQIFSHSDYVTCIQFNPVDDRYFISGSLDEKVRIWSIPDRQVVDWNDLHEMVTAACYTPDGQGALAGSYKGTCCLYNTSENKLQKRSQINLQNKKKKAHLKKITGFQFVPGSSSEVLITSADSRVRVVNGVDLVHKFKGFRNTNSQISASITSNGKYVVCASEDSHVYVWKHESESRPSRSKGVTVTRSYEHFHCQDVSVAIPWPGFEPLGEEDVPRDAPHEACLSLLDEALVNNPPPTTPVEDLSGVESSRCSSSSPFHGTMSSATNGYFFDRIMTTRPEEKPPLATKFPSPRHSLDFSNGVIQNRLAWEMVIVTAGIRGDIRTYQNFGLPFRI